MTILRHALLFLHLVGMAGLLGGLLVQVRDSSAKKILPIMRDGVGLAFLAGLLLVGVLESGDTAVNHAKVGVKFVVGLALLVLVMVNMRRDKIPDGVYYALLGLTLANVAVAVFWV